MSAPDGSELDVLRQRVEELERVVRELKARIVRLERAFAPRAENPKDQAVVQTKVVYDWQK